MRDSIAWAQRLLPEAEYVSTDLYFFHTTKHSDVPVWPWTASLFCFAISSLGSSDDFTMETSPGHLREEAVMARS
jgi:hypothetical protein